MAYTPTPSTSSKPKNNTPKSFSQTSASSQTTGQPASTQTGTNAKVMQSSQYKGSKYTSGGASPTQQQTTSQPQRSTISGGRNEALQYTKPLEQALAEQRAKKQQTVVTAQQQSQSRPKTVFEEKYLSPTNVSVLPGVRKDLPQGGYVVESKPGVVRTLAPTQENRAVAQKQAERMAVPTGTVDKARFYAGKISSGATRAQEVGQRIFPTTQIRSFSGGMALFGAPVAAQTIVQKGSMLYSIATSKQQREFILNEPDYYKIANIGEMEAQKNLSLTKAIAYNALPIAAPAIGLSDYDIAITRELQSRGYSGERLESARKTLIAERFSMGFGQTAGLISTGAGSEVLGGIQVTRGFVAKEGLAFAEKQAFGQMFRTTAPKIAQAGAYEGALSVELQAKGTYSEKPFLPSSVGGLLPKFEFQQNATGVGKYIPSVTTEARITDIAGGGLFGAASAGLIGGTIAGSKLRFPTTGKVLEYGANIIDPYEKPGDIFADVGKSTFLKGLPEPQLFVKPDASARFSFGKAPVFETPGRVPSYSFTGVNIISPTISVSPTGQKGSAGAGVAPKDFVVPPKFDMPNNEIIRNPLSPTVTTKGGGGRANTGVLEGGMSLIQQFSAPTKTGVPSFVPSTIPSTFPTFDVGYKPRAPTFVNPFVPMPTSPNTRVPIPANIPTNIFTNIPTNFPVNIPVEVPTNIPVGIPMNIPVFTPIMRLPPPILPTPPGWGKGYGAGTGRKRLKYVSELSEGGKILGDLVGGFAMPLMPRRMVQRTRSQKKKKRRR